jgi:hypothetical protein
MIGDEESKRKRERTDVNYCNPCLGKIFSLGPTGYSDGLEKP